MTFQRTSTLPVDPLFLNRWSPRSFDDQSLTQDDLLTLLEAARWAPSAYNIQPWRFLYSLRGDSHWDLFLSVLDPFNASWAFRAGALVFLLSDRLSETEEGSEPRPNGYHSFDSGAAWAQLALQATITGHHVHPMAGILREKAEKDLNIPERYKIEIAIAVGHKGNMDVLAQDLQEREYPSERLPLSSLVTHGVFKNDQTS